MKLLIVTYYKIKMMLSDKAFFAAMIVIPLLITLASGYALRQEKLDTIPLAFVDEDNSVTSGTLIERLVQKEGFRISMADRTEAVKMLKSNKVEAVFIIKDDFEEKIINSYNEEIIEMLKSPASFSAAFIKEVVSGEVMRFTSGYLAADWVSKQYAGLGKDIDGKLTGEVLQRVEAQWSPEPLMTVNYVEIHEGVERAAESVRMPAATATSAGIIVVFMMMYVLFSCGWLIEERTNGTLKRLVSAPGALGYSFAGSIISMVVLGSFQVGLFAVVDKLVFGVDLFPGVSAYAVFGAYLLAVTALSMFLSSVLKTPAQLQAGAPVLALLTGFAGGCFWNFVEMPARLKKISLMTPQGWALKGINGLLAGSGDFGVVIVPIAVLLCIALILLPLSYIIIKESVAK